MLSSSIGLSSIWRWSRWFDGHEFEVYTLVSWSALNQAKVAMQWFGKDKSSTNLPTSLKFSL